jgi:hypothetical protein
VTTVLFFLHNGQLSTLIANVHKPEIAVSESTVEPEIATVEADAAEIATQEPAPLEQDVNLETGAAQDGNASMRVNALSKSNQMGFGASGDDFQTEKYERLKKEKEYLLHRWGDIIQNDPAYSPNLTLETENFGLAWPPRIQHDVT